MNNLCIKICGLFCLDTSVGVILLAMKWNEVNISKHLTDLLYLHDFVIVPDFGAFVTNYKAAEITEADYIIPPSKSVSFNSTLTASDGLLVSYLSEKLEIEQAESTKLISEFVRDMFIDLDNKKQVIFEDLGLFEFDKNLNLIFEPNLKLNLLADTFGLSSIHYPKLEQSSKKLERGLKDRTTIKKALKSRTAKIAYFVLPILIIVSVLSTQTNVFDKSKYNYSNIADIITPDDSKQNKSNIEKELDSITKKENALMYIEEARPILAENNSTKEDNKTSENSQKEENKQTVVTNIKLTNKAVETTEEEKEEETEVINTIKKFCLVAGSFTEKRNAQRFIKKLKKKGVDAQIVEHKGKYRVAAGSFDTKTMAKKEVSRLKKQDIKTWVSKR